MVAKKTAAKKAASKKPAKMVKRAIKHTSVNKSAPMKSFRIYKDSEPFTNTRLTRQTVYWIILLASIVITQLWILKLQIDIVNLIAQLSY